MPFERLTERAKSVILGFPKNGISRAVDVAGLVDKALGMGSYILRSSPPIKLPKTTKLGISDLVREAYHQALKLEHVYVGTEHLLLALLKLTNSAAYEKIRTEIVKVGSIVGAGTGHEGIKRTPFIDTYTEDISRASLKNIYRPIIYRREYDELVATLLQKHSPNALLVGDRGVGKKAIIELLARNIAMLEVPPALAGFRVIELDIVSFMTGAFGKGGAELGLAALVEELKTAGRVILSIKNLQNIFFSSTMGVTAPIFYSMFKSAVLGADIRIIATITGQLYEKITGDNDHIFQDFTVIEIEEPEEKDTLRILEANAAALSEFHNVDVAHDVLKYVYNKAKASFPDEKFPYKGIVLLDKACADLMTRHSKIPAGYKKLVDKSYNLFSSIEQKIDKGNYEGALKLKDELISLDKKLGVRGEKVFLRRPRTALKTADVNKTLENLGEASPDPLKVNMTKLAGLSEKIKSRIIGQDTAVDSVARSLVRSRLGLRPHKRPLGNFLFLGPTGVGKTEFAKVLAEEFFGAGSLVRLDMSDFSEKHTVSRLVGAPPGYVGYGEGGELTAKIDSNPNSVVLFDEIEKAHPDVLNILLQIMEEGELADARGHTFDFSKSVVVLTSNLGTEILQGNEIGFRESAQEDADVEGRLKQNLKKILKPELLNRFDEIIVFKRLSKEAQLRVIDLLMKEIANTIKSQNMTLSVTGRTKRWLMERGYSKEYGARALRRTLEHELLDKVAQYLLEHKERPLKLKARLQEGTVLVS